jgi:curli production protein
LSGSGAFCATRAGRTKYVQQNTLSIPANQTIDLMRLSLNIDAGDTVKITVTVSDGKSLHLSQQWSPPGSALIIQ